MIGFMGMNAINEMIKNIIGIIMPPFQLSAEVIIKKDWKITPRKKAKRNAVFILIKLM
jgi:hypothetical protein